jgi:hypothetical protein
MTDTHNNPAPAVKKVRLVKVLVQPVVMIDDGETLTEFPHPALEIPASEWPTYSSERFPREIAAWQDSLNAPPEPEPKPARRPAPKRRPAAKKGAAKKGASGNPAKRVASNSLQDMK